MGQLDFLVALWFLLVFEVLSLPLRVALAGSGWSPQSRRWVSRLAGPPMLALIVWLAAHFLPYALTPFVAWGLWLAALGLAIASCRSSQCSLTEMLAYAPDKTRPLWRRVPLAEWLAIVFYFAFLAWRRWVPEMTTPELNIAVGAEKFANQMFFWSCRLADRLPPQDLWLAGEPQTYYYWGHFLWAWTTRLAGIPGAYGVTLGLARLTTLIFEAAALLARRVGLRPLASCGAACCIAWGGNLSGFALSWHTWRTGQSWANYPFWNPSRAIAHTIDEFPAFSAILGDFHAHHLALPWLLGWLALGVAALPAQGMNCRRTHQSLYIFAWSTLGLITLMTNFWLLPWMLAMAIWLVLIRWRCEWARCIDRNRLRASLYPCLGGLVLTAVFVALVVPLLRSGAGVPLAPVTGENLFAQGILGKLTTNFLPGSLGNKLRGLSLYPLPPVSRSTLGELVAMWGLPCLSLLLLGVLQILRKPFTGRTWLMVAGMTFILMSLPTGAAKLPGGTACVWLGFALVTLASMGRTRGALPHRVAGLMLASCLTLAGLELVYISDRYAEELRRYNCYFKISYPIWPLLWIGAWAAGRRLWYGISPRKNLRRTVQLAWLAILAISMTYTPAALYARYKQSQRHDATPRQAMLSSVAFLAWHEGYEAEAQMLSWIRRWTAPDALILEMPGEGAYGYTGRVGALAGRATPLGWAHHEHQWRGESAYAITRERIQAAQAVYRAADPDACRTAIRALGIDYILFGKPEREAYGEATLEVLRESVPLVMSFPADQPRAFLFDTRAVYREEQR